MTQEVIYISVDQDDYYEMQQTQFAYHKEVPQLKQKIEELEMDNASLAGHLVKILSRFDATADFKNCKDLREEINREVQRLKSSINRYALEDYKNMIKDYGDEK